MNNFLHTIEPLSNDQDPRILVYRSGAIGDTIVMSVVYQALRRHFPRAYLEAIGSVERLMLINTPGLINMITSIEMSELTSFFSGKTSLPPQLMNYFRSFDHILLYSFDRERSLEKRFQAIHTQCYRFDPFPPSDAKIHVTAYLLNTLQVLGIDVQNIVPQVTAPIQPIKTVTMITPRIAVHPGSGSPAKNWPAQHFADLCKRLSQEYQAHLIFIAGPAEDEIMQQIVQQVPSMDLEILDNRPLSEIADALQHCTLYIGNDSGISHLAAAVGIPAIVIFRTSNPDVWRPIGRQVIVLRDEILSGKTTISVDQVYIEARRFLGVL